MDYKYRTVVYDWMCIIYCRFWGFCPQLSIFSNVLVLYNFTPPHFWDTIVLFNLLHLFDTSVPGYFADFRQHQSQRRQSEQATGQLVQFLHTFLLYFWYLRPYIAGLLLQCIQYQILWEFYSRTIHMCDFSQSNISYFLWMPVYQNDVRATFFLNVLTDIFGICSQSAYLLITKCVCNIFVAHTVSSPNTTSASFLINPMTGVTLVLLLFAFGQWTYQINTFITMWWYSSWGYVA